MENTATSLAFICLIAVRIVVPLAIKSSTIKTRLSERSPNNSLKLSAITRGQISLRAEIGNDLISATFTNGEIASGKIPKVLSGSDTSIQNLTQN